MNWQMLLNVVAVPLIVLIWAAVLWFTLGRSEWWSAYKGQGPWCRRCDYALRGLRSKRCPECGVDLTRTDRARTHPRAVRRWRDGMWGAYAAWGIALSTMSMSLLPERASQIGEVALERPTSQAYDRVEITFRSEPRWIRPWWPEDMILPTEIASASIEGTDVPENSFTVFDRGGIASVGSEQTFHANAQRDGFHRWLEQLGVDVTQVEVEREADTVLDLLVAMRRGFVRLPDADPMPFAQVDSTVFRPRADDAGVWVGIAILLLLTTVGTMAGVSVYLTHRKMTQIGAVLVHPDVPFDPQKQRLPAQDSD